MLKCQICGLQFDNLPKLRTHKLSHQTTSSLTFPIPLTTTSTITVEAPNLSAPPTALSDATPAALFSLPPPPAKKSCVTVLPASHNDVTTTAICLDPPPPPHTMIDDQLSRPHAGPVSFPCPSCKAGPFANTKLRDLYIEFTHSRRSPRVFIQKEKIYTASRRTTPPIEQDPLCAVICSGPPKAPAFPKNPPHPGPRVSMPDPQVRSRCKTGRPRGRPPAARPPLNATLTQADSQDRIPGFSLSPQTISAQDPPKTPLPTPIAISTEAITHPTFDHPAFDATQVSRPASPSSSQVISPTSTQPEDRPQTTS
ncbi:hypothetical protein JTE90_018861 [Oedothorax gibbosus]|uniref:C2H2-type domain-containing protein n=1 Tax=Oedothorax gibbosus TaxID=931172 RepID=A0AAV6TUZ2_9ARAC|nr:hypothetical protein JTE90_018861 [Oedothorax gibbosus]